MGGGENAGRTRGQGPGERWGDRGERIRESGGCGARERNCTGVTWGILGDTGKGEDCEDSRSKQEENEKCDGKDGTGVWGDTGAYWNLRGL